MIYVYFTFFHFYRIYFKLRHAAMHWVMFFFLYALFIKVHVKNLHSCMKYITRDFPWLHPISHARIINYTSIIHFNDFMLQSVIHRLFICLINNYIHGLRFYFNCIFGLCSFVLVHLGLATEKARKSLRFKCRSSSCHHFKTWPCDQKVTWAITAHETLPAVL